MIWRTIGVEKLSGPGYDQTDCILLERRSDPGDAGLCNRVDRRPRLEMKYVDRGRYIRDSGKLLQICPSCSKTIECNDALLANYIQKWGCEDCRLRDFEAACGAGK